MSDHGRDCVDSLKGNQVLTRVIFAVVIASYLAILIAISIGWYKVELGRRRIENRTEADEYAAVWRYYTDETCTVALNLEIYGPCWEGVGAGYSGYFWHMSCNKDFLVYERLCGPTDSTCNLTNCEDPQHWGEKANECITDAGQYHMWTCVRMPPW
eukprot:TRINITY_DN12117_c0_g4_i2.p1 TRINITY_DN12117_c0_g4~~TRINITY_DN12117_c0_g4_i2.p1  ORF type:complete len:156 (-),score=10.43 TRINITY_DN12117_c0_g4_i2:229-696(-)